MLRRLLLTITLTMTLGLAPASLAAAQDADYPGPDGEVLSDQQDRGDAEVRGVVTARPDAVAATRSAAPSRLAVTGTDVLQLSVLGLVLLAGGTALVRRSRRQPELTASA